MSTATIDRQVAAAGHLDGVAFCMKRCPLKLLEELYSTRRVPTHDNNSVPMDVFIPREQGDFLYSLVRSSRPATTVEVGMANGVSTLFIAEAVRENGIGQHIAIDPFQRSEWRGTGLELVRRAGLEANVELVELPSHQGLPKLEQDGVRAQFMFIDGSHLFDYVLADFLCADRILDVGGLLAFDDSDWPGITQVLRFAITNRNYEVAYPDIVIEPARYSPGLAHRVLRRIGESLPKLAEKLRPDFMKSSYEMGIRGRCVVLRKLKNDDRDSQSRFHRPF